MRARLVTWNVHSCVGSDGRLDPGRVADVLAELDADFVGLQEIDSRRSRTGGVAQLRVLADRLGLHAIAGPNLVDHDGDFGNALLSRERAASVDLVDLSLAGVEPRGAIDARFGWRGRTLRVVVTHLGLKRRERVDQLGRLGELVHAGPACDATVLMGDFNEWRPFAVTRVGRGGGRLELQAHPRSFPSRLPVLRLDRILAAPEPLRCDARAIRSGAARIASDHLPVVADIEWHPTGADSAGDQGCETAAKRG